MVCWGCAPAARSSPPSETTVLAAIPESDSAPSATPEAGVVSVGHRDAVAPVDAGSSDTGAAVTWLPSDIAPTWAWYNADSFPYETTPRWGDDGNNGKGLYAATSATPMVYSTPTFTGVSGSGPIGPEWSFGTNGGALTPAWGFAGPVGWQRADGTQALTAYHASDWTFLQDGTGAFLSTVFEINGGTATQALFSTCTTSAGPGLYVQADAVARRVVVVIRNGAGEIFRYEGAAGSVQLGVPTQLTIAFATASTPDVRIWLGQTLVGSGDLTGAVSVADPAGPLTLASYTDGTGKAVASYQNSVFWKLVPTSGQITSVLENFARVGSQRTDLVILADGESTTNNPSGYRDQLFFRFSQDSRFRPRFVGDAISANRYTLPVDANKDEGWSGATFDILKGHIIASSITPATRVGLIIHMIGINDAILFDFTNPAVLAAGYARDAQCMAEIVAKCPDADRLLVTPNMSTSGTVGPRLAAFNAGLQAFGVTQGWNDFVDLMAGPYAIDASKISGDGIHPTPPPAAPTPPGDTSSGYSSMGNTIGDALGLQNAVP